MFEYLKFSIGSMLSGYKSIVIWCENGMVEYEILRAGLLDIPKGKFGVFQNSLNQGNIS